MPPNFMFITMRSSKVIFFLFLFQFVWLVPMKGQVNDAGLWASANLSKKISSDFRLTLTEEVRLFENFSEVGAFLTEIGGEYRLSKSFDVGVGYRFTNKKQLDDTYSKRHRYFFSVDYKRKDKRITTGVRVKYLSQYSDIYSSEDGSVPKNYLRSKLGFKYDTNKKYTPFITGEMFFHVNNPEGWLFDNYRISAGIEYDLTKRSQVEIRYLINKEIQVYDPWTLYVFAISWNYKL